MKLDHDFLDRLEEYGPIARTLSMCLRPTFCAQHEDTTLVWGDWSAIEARKLPWLANNRGSNAVLDVFKQVDADPGAPDIYMIEAGNIHGVDAGEINARIRDGDKEAKGWRQEGKVACIAEGQLVLTDTGLVPIEKVRSCSRVWDGIEWVQHSGAVFKGVKNVYTYQGLTATADHIVWTDTGQQAGFADCIVNGWSLARTGDGTSIRVAAFDRPGTAAGEASASPRRMHRLRHAENDRRRQSSEREVRRVSNVLATASDTYVARQAAKRGKAAVHQPQRQELEELRRARYQVQLSIRIGSGAMGSREPRPATGYGAGPQGQQRSLRTGKPTLGQPGDTNAKHTSRRVARRLAVQRRRVALCGTNRTAKIARRAVTSADTRRGARGSSAEAKMLAHYTGKVRTYDLVNAGPRNRFTVSGCLVHNCLSLGFGGGVGALMAMAVNYGLHYDEQSAQKVVDTWRESNPWAKRFWDELKEAFFTAYENPGSAYSAGRVTYIFDPDYHGGTIFCVLPCGRLLSYPNLKFREVERTDRVTGDTYKVKTLTYRKGYKWGAIWHGILAENPTQASAASVLRAKLRRIDADCEREFEAGYEPLLTVRGHTHDEIIGECHVDDVEQARAYLKAVMDEPLGWSDGLPLVSEITDHWFYTKAMD